MSNEKRLNRRQFLKEAATVAIGAALVACAQPAAIVPTKPPEEPTKAPAPPTDTPKPAAPTATPQPVAKYKEAPMLAELVKAGKLPPVDERLPINPKIITPIDRVGTYGQTSNHAALSITNYICTNQYMESLFEFPFPILSSGPVEPNLVEKWGFSSDGTQLTLYLRKGVKWSDGEPFTAEDILFLWDDVWGVKESLQLAPAALFVDGKRPEVAMVDQFTLKLTFPRPFFYAEYNLASLAEAAWPKHYMKQFHPKYNTSATWETFVNNVNWFDGRGRVTLQAWMLSEYQTDKGMKMVRNPYYWKVDTAGNQLPYIDYVVWNVVADRPMIALKCIAGEVDYDGMWVGIPQIPLFFEEKDKRGFTLGWYEHVVAWSMRPNMDYTDPVIRNVLRDVNFRRAVSLALNRQEMNKTFYYDQAIIFNACFNGVTPFFDDTCAKTYSDHDPAQAKKILDDAGYKDIDNDGARETPDGKKLDLIIDLAQHDLYVPLMEMVVDQLKAVGLKATLNIQLQDAIFQRWQNTLDWMLAVGDFGGSDDPLGKPAEFVPVTPNTPWWHKKAAEAPMSPEYQKFVEIFNKATSLPRDEMIKQMKEAAMLMADNVWVWSIGSMRRPYFIGKGVYNVPPKALRVPNCNPELRPYQIFISR